MNGSSPRIFSLLPLVLVLGLAAALTWREWRHVESRRGWGETEAALRSELDACALQAQSGREALQESQEALESLQGELQGMTDRAGNLEAQRTHLRAKLDRLENQLEQAQKENAAVEAALEEARLAALKAESRPRELETGLEQARLRNAELERRVDALARELAAAPDFYTVAGRSTDDRVFALNGRWPEDAILPRAVLVCSRGRPVLEGWISRVEGDSLLGHVGRWISPASTLVKGEKVFILAKNIHEADYQTAFSQPSIIDQPARHQRMHQPD